METNWKLLVVVLIVLVVGSFGGVRLMRKPPPPVATLEQPDAAAQAAAAPATPAIDDADTVAVSYEVQACVDDKAMLTIEGDKISWNDMNGEGLGAANCPPATRNRTTIIARSSDSNFSEPARLSSLRARRRSPGAGAGSMGRGR